MRVLFLTSHLEVGGIPLYTVTLAEQLARRGHQPVVASAGGRLVERLAAAGIPHVAVPLKIHSPLRPAAAVGLARVLGLIRRQRPDVLHAQTRVAQVVAALASRLTGVPMVMTAHESYGGHRWYRTLPVWGRRVIAVSPLIERVLRESPGVPPGSITLVVNGVAWDPPAPARLDEAAQHVRRVWGLSHGGPVIGTIARLAPVKGLPILLDAFHRLRHAVPAARLLIVGDGPVKGALIRQAYALGEQDHVILTGTVAATAVPLHLMDLFVLPSLSETFGLAIVEAMAMSRPVVASRVGGIPAVVEDGVTGLLVPPNDPDALARAAQSLLADPERMRAMGRAGRARYERRFTMDRVAREVESVYTEVVQG